MTTNILFQKVETFKKCDSGAVTVDWVVLTAAIVGIAMAVIALISSGISGASNGVNGGLTSAGSMGSGITAFVANWASDYSPISPLHGSSWGDNGVDAEGESWAEDTYKNWSELPDAELLAMYDHDYVGATVFHDPTAADYVAVQEQIMTDRGIPIPDQNATADEIIQSFEAV